MKKECKNCKYLRIGNDAFNQGLKLCKRYPPSFVSDNDEGRISDFPTTYPDDWCGEWRKK